MICQACLSYIVKPVLSLGYLPPPNDFRRIGDAPKAQTWMPTDLVVCEMCDLVQLAFEADSQVVFPPTYPYTSGTTKVLRDNFADLAEEARSFVQLGAHDLIVDIGSNDGTLLSNFAKLNQPVLGVEPTHIGHLALERGIPTIKAFFDAAQAAYINRTRGPAKIITCANCFAHIPDVHDVITGVLDLLAPDGVFITESTYLIDTIDKLQYDTIYHEHLRYYSLNSLNNLFKSRDLEIFHVKHIPTHGGSVRVYAARPGQYPIQPSTQLIATELQGRELRSALYDFRRRVARAKLNLLENIVVAKGRGYRIAGISAPSRAATVVNHCGLDHNMIDYIVEVEGSRKIGMCMPGTNIPVISEDALFADQPECAILFSWHIADELIPKLRAKGYRGQFILPCHGAMEDSHAAVA